MQEDEAALPSYGPGRQYKVPSLVTETDGNPPSSPTLSPRVRSVVAALSQASSSSSPSSPSFLSSSVSSSSTLSGSSAFLSPPSSSSVSSFSSCQRRGASPGERRRIDPAGVRRKCLLSKPSSELSIRTMKDLMAAEADAEESFMDSHAVYRRCMTDTDFKTVHGMPSQGAPDLLQLFSIFQFNRPEKPPARMLINVTLVGDIHPVRLLVAYDASVQDVINAALKAYVKEGRLPRHCIKYHNYGLHYSPFYLENIDPTEQLCTLGSRDFYLFPRSIQLKNTAQGSDERKPWWNIFGLMLP